MSKASMSFRRLREILWNNHNVSIRVKGKNLPCDHTVHPYCTGRRHGRCIGGMWRSYTLSWWDICGQSWRSDGRTKWQTLKFSSMQDAHLWKTSLSERISAGQDIFWGCQLTAFRDRFSTRSYQTDNNHVGRPRLRYKDTIKRNLKKRDIDTNSWKSLALQRDVWRDTVK